MKEEKRALVHELVNLFLTLAHGKNMNEIKQRARRRMPAKNVEYNTKVGKKINYNTLKKNLTNSSDLHR